MDKLTPDSLKKYREEKDISQEELAQRTKVPRSSISRFERGEGNLSDETEAKVLEYINRTTEDKSATPVTPVDTPSEAIVNNSLIVTTANQVLNELTKDLETTVEAHMKNVRIPVSALFSEDHTFGEMKQILTETEKRLSNEVKNTLREHLDGLKH